MKLTLSDVESETTRRYKLDEPTDVVHQRLAGEGDVVFRATGFINVTRIYKYGEVEHEFFMRGSHLTKAGEPKKLVENVRISHPTGEFAAHQPDPLKLFLDAPWDATET